MGMEINIPVLSEIRWLPMDIKNEAMYTITTSDSSTTLHVTFLTVLLSHTPTQI